MELLSIEFLGRPLRLEGSIAGWQELYWDNQIVSQLVANADREESTSHSFNLQKGDEVLHCQLDVSLIWQPFNFRYAAKLNGSVITEGMRSSKDIEQQTPVVAPNQSAALA